MRAGNAGSEDTILEIGPGKGILTKALLKTGARVITLEKDRRLIPELQQKFSSEIASGSLSLICADILLTDLTDLKLEARSYKLVANIPYYITGKIFRKFLETEIQPSLMVLLVQKEVAERIIARDSKESLLSISIKSYGEPRYVETVKAGNFSPIPSVDSAILAIENISRSLFADISEKNYFAFLKVAFKQRRKKLAGQLRVYADIKEIERTLKEIRIRPDTRAEDVPAKLWPDLFKMLPTRQYQ